MKSYSVKEVAEMLGTSEETVRRWIRSGKLEASMGSRKEGSVISENMLTSFARETPKYASSIASGMTKSSSIVGIVGAATILLGSAVVQEIGIKKANIDAKEVERLLKNKKGHMKKNISDKKMKINQIEAEIEEEEKNIQNIDYLLKSLNSGKEKEL